MIDVNPIRLEGRWPEGYALDIHTVSSTYLGEDQFGHPRYDSQRSQAGELLYQFKYHGRKEAVPGLIEAAAAFVRQWGPGVEMLVPVPPSRPRPEQPVLILGGGVATALEIDFCPACVRRTLNIPQLKDVFSYDERCRLLAGLHEVDRARVEGRRVLLFDDLFRSGATMNSIAAALYDDGHAAEVLALTITRTRSKQ